MQKTIIKLNGIEYIISFNFGVIKAVTKAMKITVPQMMQNLSEGCLETIGMVMYYGIKFNHSDFEMKEIDSLSLGEIFESFNTVGELMAQTMPTEKKKVTKTTKKK